MINTRDRLLEVAAQIFVEKGYAKATTREICLAADTNITSIHYYFESKAGLYRAIFSEPFKDFPKPLLDVAELTSKSLHDAFVAFYKVLLAPFIDKHNSPHPFKNKFKSKDGSIKHDKHHGDHHKHKIHHLIHDLMRREQFDPTGLVDDLIIGPARFIHEPLLEMLRIFINLEVVDDEIHRLAFALVSLGFSMVHPRHIVNYYAPELLNQANSYEVMYSRMADYAEALVNAESASRRQ